MRWQGGAGQPNACRDPGRPVRRQGPTCHGGKRAGLPPPPPIWQVGLEAPPEEEELEGGIDYLDAELEDIGDDEDLSLAALISGADGRALAPPPPPPIPSAQLTAGPSGGAVDALAKPSGSIALGGLLTAGSGFYTPSPPARSFGGRTVVGADLSSLGTDPLSSLGTPPLHGLASEPASLSRFGRPEAPALAAGVPGPGLVPFPGYGQPPQPQLYPPAPAVRPWKRESGGVVKRGCEKWGRGVTAGLCLGPGGRISIGRLAIPGMQPIRRSGQGPC